MPDIPLLPQCYTETQHELSAGFLSASLWWHKIAISYNKTRKIWRTLGKIALETTIPTEMVEIFIGYLYIFFLPSDNNLRLVKLLWKNFPGLSGLSFSASNSYPGVTADNGAVLNSTDSHNHSRKINIKFKKEQHWRNSLAIRNRSKVTLNSDIDNLLCSRGYWKPRHSGGHHSE